LFEEQIWSSYHSCFAVLNTKDLRHKLSEDLEIHFVELPKWHKGDVARLNSLERWLAYLSPETTDEERRQLAMEDAAIDTAMKAEKTFLSNSGYLTAYERQQMYLRDMRAMKEAARDEGHEEGFAAGCAEGEAMAMRKNISALRRKGKSASEIAELLDINLAEVEAYIQQDKQ
jgi:predicted transposase/invertase (TIGR01784 family)